MLKGLEKIAGLPIERCCTSHGPVLTKGGLLPQVMEKYRAWSQPVQNERPLIPIFYCSAYGNTCRAAEAIREGILAVKPDAEVTLYNIIEHDMAALGALMARSDAFLVGSPTLNRDAVPPVWQLLAHVDAINMAKRPVAVFGSFGWSGEAVPAIVSRLAQLKLSVFGEGLRFNFVPGETDLQNARKFGEDFAKSLA